MKLPAATLWFTGVIASVVIGWASLIGTNAHYPWDLYVGHFPDVASDKYTALAAFDGSGPYVSLDELADRYDIAEAGWKAPHPRPPASLFLQLPLVLIPDPALLWVMVPVTTAFIASLLWASTKITGIDSRWGALLLIAWIATPLFSLAVLYGSITFISVWGVVWGWWLIDKRPLAAGVILGTAAAVKLWPAVVPMALLLHKDTRPVGTTAALTAAGLTALGLTLPGASIAGTFSALTEAGTYFGSSPDNLSAVYRFGWPIAVLAIALVVSLVRPATSVNVRIGGAVVAGLLLSPIVWPNYFLAATPIVLAAAGHLRTFANSRLSDR